MRRKDFPILERKIDGHPLVYLDSAATTLKPKKVIDALSHFYLYDYGTVHRGAYSLSRRATELYAEARQKVKQFFHASFPEEIIFTRGATDSLNMIARMASSELLRPGDVVLVSEIEHHANIVAWQIAGVELRVAPVDDHGDLDLKAFARLLDKNVKIVSIAHVSNVIGTVHPVEKIVRMAHANGSLVVLDGAQSAPHMPIDLRRLNVDFFVCSGHKMYGPTGVGVLYGKKALLESLSPVSGGGDMIDQVTFEKTTFAPLPQKFEAGTPPIAEAIGLGAAIDYLNEIGMEEIALWENQVTTYALHRLQKLPHVKITGSPKQRGAILNFTVEGMHPLDLAHLLDARGIQVRSGQHCSQPAMERFGLSSSLRISFGLYNTVSEVDEFVESLCDLTATV